MFRPAIRGEPRMDKTDGTAWFDQVPGTLKLPDLEPPPTCPFILTNDVKERKTDALAHPFFSGRPVRLVFGDHRSEPAGPSLR